MSTTLREYCILVPINRTDNGLQHTAAVWREWKASLMKLAGGYSCGPIVGGEWAHNGEVVWDDSNPYYVATSNGPAIVELARNACKLFDQTCIYLRYPDGSVVLVEPPVPSYDESEYPVSRSFVTEDGVSEIRVKGPDFDGDSYLTLERDSDAIMEYDSYTALLSTDDCRRLISHLQLIVDTPAQLGEPK